MRSEILRFGGFAQWRSDPVNAFYMSDIDNIKYRLVLEWRLISPTSKWKKLKLTCPEDNGFDVAMVDSDKTDKDDLLISEFVNRICNMQYP